MWTLWTLAAYECYVQQVASSGATGAILTAMQKHPHAAGVQEQALWCLYWLTSRHPANSRRVVSLGGRNLVATAALNHSTVKGIADFAPKVICCLADNRSSADKDQGLGAAPPPDVAPKSPSKGPGGFGFSPKKLSPKKLMQKAAASIRSSTPLSFSSGRGTPVPASPPHA